MSELKMPEELSGTELGMLILPTPVMGQTVETAMRNQLEGMIAESLRGLTRAELEEIIAAASQSLGIPSMTTPDEDSLTVELMNMASPFLNLMQEVMRGETPLKEALRILRLNDPTEVEMQNPEAIIGLLARAAE